LESRPQAHNPQGQGQGLGFQGQGRCQGHCQYGSLFSQNFKTQTFIAGLVITNFILIALIAALNFSPSGLKKTQIPGYAHGIHEHSKLLQRVPLQKISDKINS